MLEEDGISTKQADLGEENGKDEATAAGKNRGKPNVKTYVDYSFPAFFSLCLITLVAYPSADNSDRAFYKDLVKVIEASDVILEVLDARDPLGTRCIDMEKMVMKAGPDKHLVLLLNKIGIH